MDKEIIKMILMVMIITCYFVDLSFLLFCPPLVLLIANVISWLIIIVIIIGFAFVEWLIN